MASIALGLFCIIAGLLIAFYYGSELKKLLSVRSSVADHPEIKNMYVLTVIRSLLPTLAGLAFTINGLIWIFANAPTEDNVALNVAMIFLGFWLLSHLPTFFNDARKTSRDVQGNFKALGYALLVILGMILSMSWIVGGFTAIF